MEHLTAFGGEVIYSSLHIPLIITSITELTSDQSFTVLATGDRCYPVTKPCC
jgi:hypothetical protein